ncbi:degenerin del-1-like, partial [Stegodyphus dumicola]|uniref:degenerin del-1-like n=1 Tax=Stegodyphus dumicola TaxID=202533 RepID=UPI0015A8EB80
HSSKEEKALQALAKEFLAQKISAAGVSYVVNSKSKFRRKLWLIAVMISMLFMGYMTFKVVKGYLKYPKMLIREEDIWTEMMFPAVTLCSLNPILNQNMEKTSIHKLAKLKEMLQNIQTTSSNSDLRDKCYINALCMWSWFSERCTCVPNPCLTEFCIGENATHCICSPVFCKNRTYHTCSSDPSYSEGCFCSNEDAYKSFPSHPLSDDYLDYINDTEVRGIVQLIRKALYDLSDIEEDLLPTTDDLFDYGVSFDNLVIACSFEQRTCYRKNFTVLYHPKYGKCYMFNFLQMKNEDSEMPLEIYNHGGHSGLRLILHVTHPQKVDLLSDEIGARVVIHDPYDLPFVEEHGFNVRPNDMSAVGVTLTVIERLGPPWGSCVEDDSYLGFKQDVKPYSIMGCQKACRDFYMTKYCGCTVRHFIRGSVLLRSKTDITFCSVANETQHLCMKHVKKSIEERELSCNCKPPCIEYQYNTKVSSSKLNENYYKAIKSIQTIVPGNEGKLKMINATAGSSLVGLKVYYSTFQVEKNSEVASYSWETLVANIGGNLGFFMGLTLITFVEILEFLWDLLCMLFKKLIKLKHQDNKVLTFPSPS